MKLRTVAGSAIVLMCCAAAPPQSPSLTQSIVGKVWIHLNRSWSYPPKEAHLRLRTAPATLIRFADTNEFSMIHCTVIEQDGQLTISNGDGQTIYLGKWVASPSRFEATFRLVDETSPPIGGRQYPGAEEEATATVAGKSLTFQDKLFDEAKTLDPAEYETFIAPERTKAASKHSE